MELIYARWLAWSTRIALGALIATFFLYMAGVLQPLIAVERLPAVWGLPVDRFLAATRAPSGWGWLAVARSGDYANLIGVAMLCLVTVLCYLRALPVLFRRSRALGVLAALQIAVLALAASGLLAAGH
jgi:hypothetical protein